jgi:hypothetical protein
VLFTILLFARGVHAEDPVVGPAPAEPAPAEHVQPEPAPAEPAPAESASAESAPAADAGIPPVPPGQEPAYLAEALTRGAVARKDGAPAGVEWVVRTGTGHALGVEEFAHVTMDAVGIRRVAERRRTGVWEGITLATIGTTLEMVAVGYLAGGNTNSSTGEDWLWRGTTFAVAGAFPIGLCTLPSRAIRDRERWTSLYYSAPEADPLIDRYNAGLRARLALPPLAPAVLAPQVPAPQVPAPPVTAPAVPAAPEDAPDLPPVDKLPDAEPLPPQAPVHP